MLRAGRGLRSETLFDRALLAAKQERTRTSPKGGLIPVLALLDHRRSGFARPQYGSFTLPFRGFHHGPTFRFGCCSDQRC